MKDNDFYIQENTKYKNKAKLLEEENKTLNHTLQQIKIDYHSKVV